MKPSKKRHIGTAVSVLVLVVIAGLPFVFQRSRPRAQVSSRGPKLVIISSHWEGVRQEFGEAFSRWMASKGTPVRVEWLDVGGTVDMVKYVQSEFSRSPKGIGIDIVFGGGVEAHRHLANKGLLSPVALTDAEEQALPAHFGGMPLRDPQGRWFGAALSGFGILYNKAVAARMGFSIPKTWKDLAAPRLMTWVGSGNPRSSGSTHMVYEIVLQAYGWDQGWRLLTRMAANVRSFSQSSAEVPRDVALGEVACGMALDSYAWSVIEAKGERRLGYVLPEGRTVINPDAIGVLKGAPHHGLAEKFVHFVLSRRGQLLWMRPKGAQGGPKRFLLARMSVRPDLYGSGLGRSAVHINPFRWKVVSFYDSVRASRRWDLLNDLLGACLIDSHEQLQQAWRAVIAAGMPQDGLEELTRPPISEADLDGLVATWAEDPELRSRTVLGWAETCRNRYAGIVDRFGSHRSGCGR